MSKIIDPWKCDACGSSKKPSNGWFIAWTESHQNIGARIIIAQWDDTLAENEGVSHICGIDCATRWQAKELAKIYGNQVQSSE